MWIATIDMHHAAIWRSLSKHSVNEPCVSLLKTLYSDQCATVLTDKGSDEFQIDPLSSLWFN